MLDCSGDCRRHFENSGPTGCLFSDHSKSAAETFGPTMFLPHVSILAQADHACLQSHGTRFHSKVDLLLAARLHHFDRALKGARCAAVLPFARHSRGQLSLGVSYWLSGFLVSLVVGLATSTITEMQETMGLRMISALSLLLCILAILASVWWSARAWRSASHHLPRGGTELDKRNPSSIPVARSLPFHSSTELLTRS